MKISKKHSGKGLLAFLVLGWWLGFGGSEAAVRTYSIVIQDSNGGYFQGQTKSMFEFMAKKTGEVSGVSFFPKAANKVAIKKIIEAGEADILVPDSSEEYLMAREKGIYKVAASFELFKQKNGQNCLFVPIAKGYKSVKELRGKQAMTYQDPLEFRQLGVLLGELPNRFFRRLKISSSGPSAIYALSLGQVDAAYIGNYAVQFAKRTNPGPLKKIKALACTKVPLGSPPILIKKTIPAGDQKKFFDQMWRVTTDPHYKTYQNLFKVIGLRFFSRGEKDYKIWDDQLREMKKNGAMEEYKNWVQLGANL